MHAIQKKDAVGNLSEAIDYEEAKDLLKQMRWENRISTGYEALDGVLGGLVRGNVTLIAGRPAMGRSSFVSAEGSSSAQTTGSMESSLKPRSSMTSISLRKSGFA